MDDKKLTDSTLRAVVRDITDQGAMLEAAGQRFTWPRETLPDGVQQGDTVTLILETESQAIQSAQERARAILTEILGGRS